MSKCHGLHRWKSFASPTYPFRNSTNRDNVCRLDWNVLIIDPRGSSNYHNAPSSNRSKVEDQEVYPELGVEDPELLIPELLIPELLNPELLISELLNPELLIPKLLISELLIQSGVAHAIRSCSSNPELLISELLNPELLIPELLNSELLISELLISELLNPELLMQSGVAHPIRSRSCNPELLIWSCSSGVGHSGVGSSALFRICPTRGNFIPPDPAALAFLCSLLSRAIHPLPRCLLSIGPMLPLVAVALTIDDSG
ncbi:hypothetical protein Vadar_017558 [Vaccinium darrowii]|uniref:Uncharacterized protein n=1 Tax=Vaccinium darrowii TaxID=229202 RepID=A0ACB7XRE2_9ERIC|nr:hypothetical protein Vadar_017558 [Vaccinium darrowii]